MSRKDDVKLLFNFMIELLKEEETKPDAKIETKKETKQVLTETPKEDESAKHILDIMKRAELMDKMRRTTMSRPTLVPLNERDEDEIARVDNERIETHKKENKTKNIKNILTNAKDFMDDLETKKPITPSVPPSVLNEQEPHLYAPISKSEVFEKVKK